MIWKLNLLVSFLEAESIIMKGQGEVMYIVSQFGSSGGMRQERLVDFCGAWLATCHVVVP